MATPVNTVPIPVGRGAATGIDPSLGERLQTAVGVVYVTSDPAAHKLGGRVKFNSAPISADPARDVLAADTGSSTRLLAYAASTVYSSAATSASFASLFTLPGTNLTLDCATLFNTAYIVSGAQGQATAPFAQFAVSGSTAIRMGLSHVISVPSVAPLGGGVLNGTYIYWTTEFDSTNQIESAYWDSAGTVSTGVLAAQNVRVTKPATVNASATHWRIYRTIASGVRPIGWLVAQVAIGTTTYDDSTTDATLVLNDEYRIITINDIPESMDEDPGPLALSSICAFEGNLVGTTGSGGDLAYTPAGEPHSWPVSYRITCPTQFGGQSKCVRKCGGVLFVAFESELFRVNYLPDENDAVFSTGLAVEHVANYGTPSATGMCTFTAGGGVPMLFVASGVQPIIAMANGETTLTDFAVKAIDWDALIVPSLLHFCKAIDNPHKQRVELYYRDSTTDSTSWKRLDFYYDSGRSTHESGALPEMSWTGPHPVPGPGAWCIASGAPKAFTASTADSYVYVEDVGTVDNALLTDSSGSIPFTLRTQKVYPAGLDEEVTAQRVYINRQGGGSQDYTVTFTGYREEDLPARSIGNIAISGQQAGNASHGLNLACSAFDVTIDATGTTAMAPINNLTVRHDEPRKALKTTVTA